MDLSLSDKPRFMDDQGRVILTHTMLQTFRCCSQKALWRYGYRLEQKGTDRSHALAFGSHVATCLELYKSGKDYAGYLLGTTMAAQDLCKVRAIVAGYIRRWQDSGLVTLEVEKEFLGRLVNPATGRPASNGWLSGKRDEDVLVLEDNTLNAAPGMYVLETKTMGQRPDKRALWFAFQPTLYMHAAKMFDDLPVQGFIYDILYKNQCSNRRGESVADFQARMHAWHAKEDAYERIVIPYDAARMDLFRQELWDIWKQYRRFMGGKWWRNEFFCKSYGRPCEYLELCGSSRGHDRIAEEQYQRFVPHSELKIIEELPVHG